MQSYNFNDTVYVVDILSPHYGACGIILSVKKYSPESCDARYIYEVLFNKYKDSGSVLSLSDYQLSYNDPINKTCKNMKIPDVGDEVFITMLGSEYYGCRARVQERKEGKSYNYGCEYHYAVLIDTGDTGGSCVGGFFNDLEISFQRPKSKEDVLANKQIERSKSAIRRIAEELSSLTLKQQQECLGLFLFQSIEQKIDSADVIGKIFK